MLAGKRIGIDATTLDASAAMGSIVRRDTGEIYEEFLAGLAKASGIETPTREDLARHDRKRKKRTSNKTSNILEGSNPSLPGILPVTPRAIILPSSAIQPKAPPHIHLPGFWEITLAIRAAGTIGGIVYVVVPPVH